MDECSLLSEVGVGRGVSFPPPACLCPCPGGRQPCYLLLGAETVPSCHPYHPWHCHRGTDILLCTGEWWAQQLGALCRQMQCRQQVTVSKQLSQLYC